MTTIKKSAAILIQDKKLLVTKSYGKDIYIAPGGKLQAGETAQAALIRELQEELHIYVLEQDLEYFGTFEAEAAGQTDAIVEMTVFLVHARDGEPKASQEVESLLWVTSQSAEDIKLGSIFAHEVIPKLKDMDLIN